MENLLYEANLNLEPKWFVREKGSIVSFMFESKEDAEQFMVGNQRTATGVAINNEVMIYGKVVGSLEDINYIK